MSGGWRLLANISCDACSWGARVVSARTVLKHRASGGAPHSSGRLMKDPIEPASLTKRRRCTRRPPQWLRACTGPRSLVKRSPRGRRRVPGAVAQDALLRLLGVLRGVTPAYLQCSATATAPALCNCLMRSQVSLISGKSLILHVTATLAGNVLLRLLTMDAARSPSFRGPGPCRRPSRRASGSPYLSQHQPRRPRRPPRPSMRLALRRAELHDESVFLSDRVHAGTSSCPRRRQVNRFSSSFSFLVHSSRRRAINSSL